MIPVGRKVAVVLSGCGVFDGAEITESVSLLVHLSKHKAQTAIFAPNAAQFHTIDHFAGKPETSSAAAATQPRNILVEANRIGRGAVQPLDALKPTDFDVLMFPGGFGVMKNLSNFAVKGADETGAVRADVLKVLVDFHAARKPIGVACIAPILVAQAIKGATITLGAEQGDAADLARSLGAVVVAGGRTEAVVDPTNRVVSTAAYMYDDATPSDVFDALGALVEKTLSL